MCTLLHFTPQTDFTTTENRELRTEKNFFRFGDQLVTLEAHGYAAAKNYVLLSLHSNETSSIAAALNFTRTTDAFFIRLVNSNKRNIEGYFLDTKINFDPNNIYTDWGRKEHLKDNNCWTKYIDLKVEQFSQFILNEIPYDKTIVSLHSHKGNTIQNYAAKRKLNRQVKALYINSTQSPTDYFLTTDESIFERLKERQYNVLLMHPKKMENKGGLAVYCARTKRPYVQVETGEENTEMQEKMLMVIDGILK